MQEKFSKGWGFAQGLRAEMNLLGRLTKSGDRPMLIDQAQTEVRVQAGDRVVVNVESKATKATVGSALVIIRFEDEQGNRLTFPWPSRSEEVGEYQYLSPAEPQNASLTQFVVDAPQGAVRLVLSGKTWNRYTRTLVLGTIRASVMSAPANDHSSAIAVEFSAKDLLMRIAVPESSAQARIIINHTAHREDSSSPITVKYWDNEGNEILGASDLAQHAKLGPFFSLDGKFGQRKTTVTSVQLPNSIKTIGLEGVDWGAKTANLNDIPKVIFEGDAQTEIRDFLSEIPAEDQLLVIDTTAPPLGHGTLSLRPNNLTPQYEKLGTWVIFLPFGRLQEFPSRVSGKVLQVPRSEFQILLSALRKNRNSENSIYICSSFPNFQSVTAATLLKSCGWSIVYECRDDMEEFNRVGYSKWYSQELERYFLRTADKVVAVSPSLLEKLQDMVPFQFDGVVIPNGVPTKTLETSRHLRKPETLPRKNELKTVGYVGHLTASWFDWQAVIHAATKMPDVSFEIVGHGMPENLSLPRNVRFLGPKTHEELLSIVPSWKVGLIPFLDMPLTRSVDPNKIYEYFSWGIRCVTSQMGSVQQYPSTWVYSGRDGLVKALREAVYSSFDSSELEKMSDFVADCSWLTRAEQMKNFMLLENAREAAREE